MHDHQLRLADLRLGSGDGLEIASANAMLYVADGAVTVSGEPMTANRARHLAGAAEVLAGAGGARLLLFQLAAPGAAAAPGRELLAETVRLDPKADYLMRCDRVDFPPGGIAYLHTHQGPGIRCLLKGGLTVETGGRTHALAPFEAWFESGPEPVLATASPDAATAFVRVMILPRALLGRSSIRYVRPEDAEKPKPQAYTVFQDVAIEI